MQQLDKVKLQLKAECLDLEAEVVVDFEIDLMMD
jgi:hypothetical protein